MAGIKTKAYLLETGFYQIRRKHVPRIEKKQRSNEPHTVYINKYA